MAFKFQGLPEHARLRKLGIRFISSHYFLIGIPIGSSPTNVGLARQFDLPKRQLIGHWERKRGTSKSHFIQVPIETKSLKISDPQQV